MRNFLPILLIVISIAAFFALAKPLYEDVSDLRNSVAVYDTALTNSTNLEKTLNSLLTQYNNITPGNKIGLERLMPNTVDNIQLILEIQKMAAAGGMSLKNIKFDTPTTTDGTAPAGQSNVITTGGTNTNTAYGTFAISFTVDGTYSIFETFLSDLERNLRLVNIKTVSFSVPSQSATTRITSTGELIYTFNLKIETYWLK